MSDEPSGKHERDAGGEEVGRRGDVRRGYEALARAAAEDDLSPTVSPWGDSHFQREYAWPGLRDRLPPVVDADVLLVGCGRGDHVQHYLAAGATVTGVDVSSEAVATARARFDEASFAVADVTADVPFDEDAFDVAVANLVLSHVPDLEPVLAEVRRVLEPDGAFATATIHPAYQRWHWGLDAYADETSRVVDWGATSLRSYYRSTSTILQAFVDAGFALEAVAEPTPQSSYREVNADRYAAAVQRPQVLVVRGRAVK